ncbi:MAG: hypothetical protein RBR50_07935 [Candidatus Izemoplasmatales bacterium]|nr:hypothetical protein [Candidatus Izemoplasmatales bacterium]
MKELESIAWEMVNIFIDEVIARKLIRWGKDYAVFTGNTTEWRTLRSLARTKIAKKYNLDTNDLLTISDLFNDFVRFV